MTSRQLVDFVVAKFAERGVRKLIPDDTVIAKHARRIIEQQLLAREIDKISRKIAKQVKSAELPTELREQVEALLAEKPTLSWDEAVARIAKRVRS